jgi:hypothetical protein
MLKGNLIKYVKKLGVEVDITKPPYDIMISVKKDETLQSFFRVKFKGIDSALLFLLLPHANLSYDKLSSLYDRIKNSLVYIEFISIDKKYDEVECDVCFGDKSISCYDCEGDGEDEEGEPCNTCSGDGEETCYQCDGKGEIKDFDSQQVELIKFLTYNQEIINYLRNLGEKEVIDSDILSTYYDDMETMFLDSDYLISEEHGDFSEGDIVLETFDMNPKIEYSDKHFYNFIVM